MKTITFYSYKGGVGRSLALANFALYLAARDRNVFVIDFDLEAPGLHYKLSPSKKDKKESPEKNEEIVAGQGFVDYLNYWDQLGTIPIDLENYIYNYKTELPGTINIMPAGNSQDPQYWDKLSLLDWHNIFLTKDVTEPFRNLKSQIDFFHSPDYLLIDARTGITPVGGIATALMMPDSVVMLFNNNPENRDGIIQVTRLISENPLVDQEEPTNIFPVVVRLPVIDREYDDGINTAINKFFQNSLTDSTEDSNKGIKLFSSQILHTDREVEVVESLLIGNSNTNESSVLYRDYLILFQQLRGKEIPSEEELLEATKVSYADHMDRVLSILEQMKKEPKFPIPRELWKKIEAGKVHDSPQADPVYNQFRTLWNLDFDQETGVKNWESHLSNSIESLNRDLEFNKFWVLLPRFLAYEDLEFLNITGKNLMKGAKYIYFLPNSSDVDRLKMVAKQIISNLEKDKGRRETQETIRRIVAQGLHYAYIPDKLIFLAYLRNYNHWIPNPKNPLPDSKSCPPGFEVITDQEGRATGAVPLKSKECEEIYALVMHFCGDGKDIKSFSAIEGAS